ncbi:MAG TPA: endo-1,4-beta-xylanase [Blastocatellia bacterium]|nr:endo-1,4-beta-xylanase [Blastocatellia bacterium]
MSKSLIKRREFLAAAMLGGAGLASACSQASSAGRRNVEVEKLLARRDAFENAMKGIGRHRQGEAIVRVADRGGAPVKDARVTINQLSHDFRFGCELSFRGLRPENLAIYQERFPQLFNYGTVGVYWSLIQSVPSVADWDQVRAETEWGLSQGLRLKGHPLVWGAQKAGTPRWLPQSKAGLEAAMRQRIRDAVTRFRGRMTTWDVVNEPLDGGLFEEVIGSSYLKQAFQLAREADPQAQLVMNEYGILGADSKRRQPYFDLLQKLGAEEVPFDVVGIQAHEPRGEWFDPAVVTSALDQFARLGKKIHITEFTAQSDPTAAVTGGYRQGRWERKKQEEYFREFYTICFGHPQVEAITVWGLDDERAWVRNCGLLDDNWQPKPAWQALRELISHDWHTMHEVRVRAGSYRLRGFYGNYEVKVTLEDETEVKRQFALRQCERNEWLIEV